MAQALLNGCPRTHRVRNPRTLSAASVPAFAQALGPRAHQCTGAGAQPRHQSILPAATPPSAGANTADRRPATSLRGLPPVPSADVERLVLGTDPTNLTNVYGKQLTASERAALQVALSHLARDARAATAAAMGSEEGLKAYVLRELLLVRACRTA
jgi:hypothetical protein